jgi:radical SAM superfamily enzyme YgiQ (UPF0313 family)
MNGKKIVLAASRTESNEREQDCWMQMLYATLPANIAHHFTDLETLRNELRPDGQARYVPNGLRVVESILLEYFAQEDVAVCYPDQLDQFLGDDTLALGIHAHNPLGITFATDVYAQLAGIHNEPLNATEWKKIVQHPAVGRHKQHLKILVGGPGAWQILHAEKQNEWGIDCIIDGEAEAHILPLFQAAVRGEPLPRSVKGESPRMDEIPITHHRSTLGVVEITRGCGRGCQFCGVAVRRGRSIPLENILLNVRANVADGADTIMLTTEDLFLYDQGPRFQTNTAALVNLYKSVAAEPGVRYVHQTHATIAPVVLKPQTIEELTPYAVDLSRKRHPASTHPDKRYASVIIGLETGSVSLFKKYMPGKSYPFRPEQWPDVVLKGMEILNRYNWFPFCTWIIGLPGETEADTRESLDLLHAMKGSKWVVVPTLFTPLEDTRLGSKQAAKLPQLTELQWEFFFTCWRYNLDFFQHNRSWMKFYLGTPIYYYLLGRKLFGDRIKYPLWRFAHVPEKILRHRLYLDLDAPATKFKVPQEVPVTLAAAASSSEFTRIFQSADD